MAPEEITRRNLLARSVQSEVSKKISFINFPSDERKSQLLSQLTLLQIKGLCKDANKSTTGTKKELIDRLLQFGDASSPYKHSAVRTSERKPGTPKIPDLYPNHMVNILLHVIGINNKKMDEINLCFKAILSRRVISLLRPEDFLRVKYEFQCPCKQCNASIKYTNLDILAQGFNVLKTCQSNHSIYVSGICCGNPVAHFLNQIEVARLLEYNDINYISSIAKHINKHWLYGYCDPLEAVTKFCEKCNAPTNVCRKSISKLCVSDCGELANLKDVKPFAKTRKKNKKGLKINSIKADENVKKSIATVSKAKHSKKISKGQSHDRKALKVMKKKVAVKKNRTNLRAKDSSIDNKPSDISGLNLISLVKTATDILNTNELLRASSNESDTEIMMFEEVHKRRVGKKSKSPQITNYDERTLKKSSSLIIKSAYLSSPVSQESSDHDYSLEYFENSRTPQMSLFTKPVPSSMMIYGGKNRYKGLSSSGGSSMSDMNNSINSDDRQIVVHNDIIDAPSTDDRALEKDLCVTNATSNDSKSGKSPFMREVFREFQDAFSPVCENQNGMDFIFDVHETQYNDVSDISLSDLPHDDSFSNISKFELNDSEDIFDSLNISGVSNDIK